MNISNRGNGTPFRNLNQESPNQSSVKFNRYIKIDNKSGLVGSTSNLNLASTPAQVKKFMENYGSTLGEEQATMLEMGSLKHGKIAISQHLSHGSFFEKTIVKIKKIAASASSFVKNFGETDQAIVKKINQQALEQKAAIRAEKFTHSFHQEMDFKIQINLEALILLKTDLSKAEEKLSSIDPQSDEAKELKENAQLLKNNIAYREQALRSPDSRKLIMAVLKEIKVSEEDFAEVVMAKNKFQEEHKEIIDEMRSSTAVRFEENAEIRVKSVFAKILLNEEQAALKKITISDKDSVEVIDEKKKFYEKHKKIIDEMKSGAKDISVPTNFSDRVNNAKKIGPKRGSQRSPEDSSVKKHIKEHYEREGKIAPNNAGLVSIEKLIDETQINFVQLEYAAAVKLWDINQDTLQISNPRAKEGAVVVGKALRVLMLKLPDENIHNQHDLKKALIDKISNDNQKKEMVDKKMLGDLVGHGKIKKDLLNAPELKEVLRSYADGSWEDGEKELTFTTFNKNELPLFIESIHYFFDDPSTQKVLEHFVPLGNSGALLANDVAAIKKRKE